MTWYSLRTRTGMCGVVIDIGSGSVAASIVYSDHRKEIPEVVFMHREFMPVRTNPTAADRVRHMRRALFGVLMELSQKGIPSLREKGIRASISRLMVSCTAPWSQTATQIIHFEKDAPFVVTKSMVDEIIAHAYEKEAGTLGIQQKRSLSRMKMEMVEHSIIKMMLNGYSSDEPYGKTAVELDIVHVRGFVPKHLLTAVDEIKKNILTEAPLQVHTSALILYCVLRDVYPQLHNALIIEVSGEATECSLMQEDILYESVSVPYGMHTLTRTVAKRFNTIPEEARTYLRCYKQDALTETHEKTLTTVQKQYSKTIGEALIALSERYPLPSKVFLIIDQNMEPFFTDAVHAAIRDKGGAHKKVVIPITPAHAAHFAEFEKNSAPDPRLAMLARFFHKLHACGEIDN